MFYGDFVTIRVDGRSLVRLVTSIADFHYIEHTFDNLCALVPEHV